MEKQYSVSHISVKLESTFKAFTARLELTRGRQAGAEIIMSE